jgi:hypothetical protein
MAVTTDEDQIRQALALLVTYREAVLPTFGRDVRAVGEIEQWLETGDLTDPESSAAVEPHVRDALEALSVLGGRSLQVVAVAQRTAQPQRPEWLN